MMMLFSLFVYCIAVYGVTNIVVHSNGPLWIFKFWRKLTNSIHPAIGELFSCVMCFSTWVGFALSLIDIYVLKNQTITPFNMILNNESVWLVVLLDMFFASGVTWLIHQFEELMERTNPAYYEEG